MPTALHHIVRVYQLAHTARPLATSMVLGGVIAATGDVLAQRLVEKQPTLNWLRSLEMVTLRSLILAPFLYLYFPWLLRVCPGTTWGRVLSRVGLDQLTGSPIVISTAFLFSAVFKDVTAPKNLVHNDISMVPARIQSHLPRTWLMGASFWPIVHTLNFRMVPVGHQPLVAHLGSVYWMMILSHQANSALTTAHQLDHR
jgi:hypothetical protein